MYKMWQYLGVYIYDLTLYREVEQLLPQRNEVMTWFIDYSYGVVDDRQKHLNILTNIDRLVFFPLKLTAKIQQ